MVLVTAAAGGKQNASQPNPAVSELERRGTHRPHLIAPMDDHDLWMAFFEDPDGHTLAVMQEAPKRYEPKMIG
jgi:hypothetical protein